MMATIFGPVIVANTLRGVQEAILENLIHNSVGHNGNIAANGQECFNERLFSAFYSAT